MNRFVALIALGLIFCSSVFAGDIYEVKVMSQTDADILNSLSANPIVAIKDGYVVYIPDNSIGKLYSSGLDAELVYSNISSDNLFFESPDVSPKFEIGTLVYQKDQLRLIQIDAIHKSLTLETKKFLTPVIDRTGKVYYNRPSASNILLADAIGGLDTLIAKISQDSLESFTYRLQAFNGRSTGSDSAYASRDWIADKFTEFGYTDVRFQQFTGRELLHYTNVQSYNVIAVKQGVTSPDEQIVIGAHYDAVPGSPGADDNGSGTAAVLELSRVLYNIETDKTIIFVLFDSEESGLIGGYAYADAAKENNDNIVVMLNADMIANIGNSDQANLFTGAEQGYAYLWNNVVDSLVNIQGFYGTSGSSDHAPFVQNGYDAVFYHERLFSSVYHSFRDSTSYMDFEYFTRMTKGILASAYSVSQVPAPVQNLQVFETGTGNTLLCNWDLLNSPNIDYYEISYYKISNPSLVVSVQVDNVTSEYLVENLHEGSTYNFYVQGYDYNGNTAVVYDLISKTPSSVPSSPQDLEALPQFHAIKLRWTKKYQELDFDHYNIYRDSSFLISTTDTFYIDNSPTLGTDFHEYYVLAVDTDGKQSLFENAERVLSKSATLEKHRILALNRSNIGTFNMVDVTLTGKFMRDALAGYNFDYYADTAYTKLNQERPRFSLYNMIDYEIVVIGGESGLYDDLVSSDAISDMSQMISTYLEIGGKLVVFGRWGLLSKFETLTEYNENSPKYLQVYSNCFDIASRLSSESNLPLPTSIEAELRGANSQQPGYPDLNFDSVITAHHTDPYVPLGGIPLSSCVTLNSMDADPIYTFESINPLSNLENKTVAWKNLNGPNRYDFFDIPLSFFEKDNAMTALRKAVEELSDIPTDIVDNGNGSALPKQFVLGQNYPNPFNPSTTIEFSVPERTHTTITVFNILGQQIKTLTDKVYPAGEYEVIWDGDDSNGKKVASGIYLYKISGKDFSESKKMVLLK